jgi:transposase
MRLAAGTLEAFHKGKRVASHPRSYDRGQAITAAEHRPASHRAYLEWTPSRIEAWARGTGPATAELASAIIARCSHPEQGYRACLGVIRLGKKYGAERLETACRRALLRGAASYKSVKSILSSGLDRTEPEPEGRLMFYSALCCAP